MLNAAADKKLGKCNVRIVNALYNGLIKKGNLNSAKVLFDLADGLIDCENPEVMSQLCSYAESLTSEQQVAADAGDAAAETENKEREAELAIQQVR